MHRLAAEGSRSDIPLPLDMTSEDPCMLASLIHIDDSAYCDNVNGTKGITAEDRSTGAYISPKEAPGGFWPQFTSTVSKSWTNMKSKSL